MILGTTIQNRLDIAQGSPVGFDFDIRYLGRWLIIYPECFPKFMLNENFTTVFNGNLLRWEIIKGKHKIEFNPQNYL